jgi:hypothetical protein
MIPSIFEYLPSHAGALFTKVAEYAVREDPSPEVVPPNIPAEPRVERPVPHPYGAAARHLLPIGLGLGLGTAAGLGIPYALQKAGILQRPPYALLGGVSAVGGGLAGMASSIMNQHQAAEVERAKQEYQDYLTRGARDLSNPSVQPPSLRP